MWGGVLFSSFSSLSVHRCILVNVLFSYFSPCLFPLFIFLHWCYSHFHLFKLGVFLVWFTCKYADNETFHYLGLTLMYKMSHASCIHYSSDCITCHACRSEVIPWWGPWPVSVHVWLCFTIKKQHILRNFSVVLNLITK